MKKYYITILLALVALTGWTQVNPTIALLGSWSGKLNVGAVSLTLVLHLEQTDGYVTASLDSPDQGAKGIPAFSKVGILGHSEGGLIAFMLAAKKQTDFIVSLAGPGVKGDTLLVAQGNRILSLSGMPANMTVEKYRQQDAVQQMPWLKWFIDYDPSADIAATRCPVFALNGDRDCQVISSQNLTAIERLLPKSKQHLIKEYPGLNHLFQHCTTGLVAEYSQIEETISPEVLSDIANWINSLK